MNNVALTINYVGNDFFSNGLGQNIKFFYDLLELLGFRPYLIVADDHLVTDNIFITQQRKKIRMLSLPNLLNSSKRFSFVFEIGFSISHTQRQALRDNNKAKIISVRYGNSLLLDMESIVFPGKNRGKIHFNKPDAVWISPHFRHSITYFKTIYQAPVFVAPFIWEPDFIADLKVFKQDSDHEPQPDLYVMEPNINLLKNALVPMGIIENVYRTKPDAFAKAFIVNGRHFNDLDDFLSNIVENMSCLLGDANKVFFSERAPLADAFKKRDALLCFQNDNELNYLYSEALWLNVPVIHNSPSLQAVGYYYPKFDLEIGSQQCLSAINDSHVAAQYSQNRKFLQKFSIHNQAVQLEYLELLRTIK